LTTVPPLPELLISMSTPPDLAVSVGQLIEEFCTHSFQFPACDSFSRIRMTKWVDTQLSMNPISPLLEFAPRISSARDAEISSPFELSHLAFRHVSCNVGCEFRECVGFWSSRPAHFGCRRQVYQS